MHISARLDFSRQQGNAGGKYVRGMAKKKKEEEEADVVLIKQVI